MKLILAQATHNPNPICRWIIVGLWTAAVTGPRPLEQAQFLKGGDDPLVSPSRSRPPSDPRIGFLLLFGEQYLEVKPTVLFGRSDLLTRGLNPKLVLTDRGRIWIRIS